MVYIDIERALESSRLSDRDLLSFACRCCDQLLESFDEPILGELLVIGRRRIDGKATADEIASIGKRFGVLYESLYPGGVDPSPLVLALSAVSETVYTRSPLTAALNASGFAARAIAKLAGEADPNGKSYDQVLDNVYRSIREMQKKLLPAMDS